MSRYQTMAMDALLDAFASSEPTPGGGSAAALTGSLGVSLLLMVAGMSKTRSGAAEEVADLGAAAARLRPVREQLIAIIDEDSRAYQEVLTAFRQPRGTEAEKAARRQLVDAAVRAATEIPLETMRLCEEALREAPLIARSGNPNAVTDAAVGARLLLAALECAGLNVDVNLRGVTDANYVGASAEQRRRLLVSARQLAGQVEPATGQ